MSNKPRVVVPVNEEGDAISGSALALQPESMQAFNQLYGTLWSRGLLPHTLKEIARLRNARTTNCVFCKSVRFEQAQSDGLDESMVANIDDDFEHSDLGDREKLVIRYTDVFLQSPGDIPDSLKQAMRNNFSSEEIVELTAAVAIFMGFSKIAVSLGGMPESLPVFTMPTPV